jgi:hypothetical protein
MRDFFIKIVGELQSNDAQNEELNIMNYYGTL